MTELTEKMNWMLFEIHKKRWISLSLTDPQITFDAKTKLAAYSLIERQSKTSWKLTKDGYDAVELGGFDEWQRAKDLVIETGELSKPQDFEKQKANMDKKVFVSHSSKDVDVVEKVIDILEAIGVPSEQIFCSSFDGYGVKLGDDFLETIKTELNSNVLVLFILSSNFYSSVVSLCEMGATWVKTSEHIPILIPPFEYSEIKGVIPTIHGMKINEKQKFNLLKEKVEDFMNINQTNFSAWERKRDNVLKEIKTTLDKRALNPIIAEEQDILVNHPTDNKELENVDSTIKKLSKKAWPEDFEMQLNYIQRQKSAVESLKTFAPTDISSTELNKIRKNSQKEWEEDFEMQLDYIQRQVESLRKLNAI